MNADDLDRRIRELLAFELNLEDGVMMMPLNRNEIDSLHHAIRDLVHEALREAA